MMIVTADFAYDDAVCNAHGGIVAFDGWPASEPAWTGTIHIDAIEPYEPGAFYRRELPCWLRALELVRQNGIEPDVLVVDGYASFGPGRDALGAHLHKAVGLRVVGVAKTPFHGASHVEVLRGTSASPLLVTAVGMDADEAAIGVKAMAGPHRMPVMLALADSLARRRVIRDARR